jgi:large subunit ribosomal protein L21
MYAIVEIAGLQYKVEKDQQIYVNRLQGDEGDKLSFDRVMLTDDSGNVTVGAPVIEGVAVNATILKHLKGDKVLVFKKKRRKGYQKLNGHRQYLTQISIDGFGKANGKAKKGNQKSGSS